jgi:chromosome segregation protein
MAGRSGKLLKLKKLQILGFKSFCERTELRFHGDGVAAIVGPNGCGKSNIADAICWVLGEQSAKSLRGSRMEDVIFAGTPARKPTGMAEVSLTLVDPEAYEGPIAAEPEIEIGDELPQEDWDEEALRANAEEEMAQYLDQVQPGKTDEEPGRNAAAPAREEPEPTRDPADAPASAIPDASQDTEPGPDGESSLGSAPPTGLATGTVPHVVLRIRRRKFRPLALKKGEIVITRRLFRSGESEYLLNHKLCRLRDIQDLFMGTGLGPESYAIIEQGRIGQILSSKPTDRRAILEEAAGITKFKAKKRLAEARLEDARQNLNRVNDIFEEVTRQMNSLKRQASKAARYVRLRDEMREKLRVVLASRFAQLDRQAVEHAQQLENIAEEMRKHGESIRDLEAEKGERTQLSLAVESAQREQRDWLADLARQADRTANRQKQNEERCAELDQRAAEARQELGQIEAKAQLLQAECEGNRQVLESAQAEVAAAQQLLNARQQDATAATEGLAGLEKQQEMRRISILEAANAAATVRNRITQAEERMASLAQEAQRLTGEIDASQVQLESFGGERGQLALEFESVSQRLQALLEQIGDTREQLEERRRAETDSKHRLDGLRAEYANVMGKKSSLETVIAEHGYSTDSVRRLFKSGMLQNGFAPAGVLADFLEVEGRYEHVVEEFLRDELNYVVVKSWDAADRGLQLLRSDVDGRATFMVHPEDSQAKFPFVVNGSHRTVPPEERVISLKSCIRVLNGFGNSLEVILPKLRDGYIVPDAETGRDLALEDPDAFFLAPTGECFHNVTVTGGKPAASGPLSLKRELREVLGRMAKLETKLRDEETSVLSLGHEIQQRLSLLQRLEDERRETERQALTCGHSLRQLDTEMARVRERLEVHERDLQRATREHAARQAYVAEQREELAQREQMQAELEQTMAAAQHRLAELRLARDAAAQNASEVRAQVATMEERRRAALQALRRIESLLEESTGRIGTLNTQIASALTEKGQRETENLHLADCLAELAEEWEVFTAWGLELQAKSAEVQRRLGEIEHELREAREILDRARDQRGEVSAELARLQSDADHMSENCLQELGITGEQLRADDTVTPVDGEQLAAEESASRELRSKIENLGPVNMMALEEFNEVSQRHEFLETQRRDLVESIHNTQETIREIESVSRQKFDHAFAIINGNFQATFRKLFGGGQAFMKLTDEQNSMESGIDLVVSPPGKRLQNVLLLSGGEKALTALALLVGIFQYQPSPFCILDEVDAPLDESNIGRFTELVREMSSRTQFILITHSKKTMGAAPVMYGVTMQEPGVSKLVSVRFAEPAATAVN